MGWRNSLPQAGQTLIREGFKNPHRIMISCGLLVALCYLVVRLVDLTIDTFQGSVGMLLFSAAGLGVFQLWTQRQRLQEMKASEEDCLVGYLLIGAAVIAYPFWFSPLWAQALVCLVALAGVACCCWGTAFFARFPLAVFLIAVGILPRMTVFGRVVWQALTPDRFLEKLMAQGGSLGLRSLGFAVEVEQQFIRLPNGAVEVAWGCNGFDMAVTMMVASFVLGLFLQQSRSTIALMIGIGAVLALIFNIPRIMLVTIAAVYWGTGWFDFWHGPWGGQVFVGILFTLYYYVVMAIAKRDRSAAEH